MKIKRIASLALALLMTVCIFAGCQTQTTITKTNTITFTLNDLGTSVNLHTKMQNKFIEEEDPLNATDYAIGMLEMSIPTTVEFNWSVSSEGNEKPLSYVVAISEDENMEEYIEYTQENLTSLTLQNLKIGTTYYWRVTAMLDGGSTYTSAVKSFSTSPDCPRFVCVDGITNCRDIGGWACNTGKVKQGMIYRCGQLDAINLEEGAFEPIITDEGKDTMLNQLGIKTEIDLRSIESDCPEFDKDYQTTGALGPKVNYVHAPMNYNYDIISDQQDMIKQVFEVFADEENYPVIFHCAIGTDRTGLIAFLLNGLLGVKEQDLYRDYMWSNFGLIYGTRDGSAITSYIDRMQSYGGDSLSEQIRNYLISIDLTEEQLDTIVKLMTK